MRVTSVLIHRPLRLNALHQRGKQIVGFGSIAEPCYKTSHSQHRSLECTCERR